MLDNFQGSFGQAQQSNNNGTIFIVLGVLLIVGVLFVFGTIAKNEAIKQERSSSVWFWLGFFFMFNAFIALKVSKAADEEGHSLLFWSAFGVLCGVMAILAFESGLNAENKLHDFDCWCILGFCFGIVALFVSCFLKPFERVQKVITKIATPTTSAPKVETNSTVNGWTCAKCSHVNMGSSLFCSKCGSIKNVK